MPKPKDARRLIPDPENEPDFYAISQVYPLPDEEEYREKQASKPAPEDELPEAGMPRFASDLIGLNNDGLPPAKRTRTVAPDTTITASSSALPASATADLLAKLANPSTGRNQEVLSNATSLSGVGGGNLPLSASSLTGAATSLNTATSAAMGLPVGDALAAFRTPHMQAALDRNVAVLAALRARIPSQHRAAASLSLPAARNDPTATLAAALMQQANGTGAATNNSISLGGNPLGSLFGRF